MNSPETVRPVITYDTSPEQYQHWSLACDGAIATLTLNINEDGGIKPGYKLKLNSYDLGVDMELHDALQRVRFEHPEVRPWSSPRARTASSAPAPTSSCSASPPTPGR
jgi:hypothetical protein